MFYSGIFLCVKLPFRLTKAYQFIKFYFGRQTRNCCYVKNTSSPVAIENYSRQGTWLWDKTKSYLYKVSYKLTTVPSQTRHDVVRNKTARANWLHLANGNRILQTWLNQSKEIIETIYAILESFTCPQLQEFSLYFARRPVPIKSKTCVRWLVEDQQSMNATNKCRVRPHKCINVFKWPLETVSLLLLINTQSYPA